MGEKFVCADTQILGNSGTRESVKWDVWAVGVVLGGHKAEDPIADGLGWVALGALLEMTVRSLGVLVIPGPRIRTWGTRQFSDVTRITRGDHSYIMTSGRIGGH